MSEALDNSDFIKKKSGRKARLRVFFRKISPNSVRIFLFKRRYALHDLKLEQDKLLRAAGALPIADTEALVLRHKFKKIIPALYWVTRSLTSLAPFFIRPVRLAVSILKSTIKPFEKVVLVVARPIVYRSDRFLRLFRSWWRGNLKYYPILLMTVTARRFLNPIKIVLSGERRRALNYYLRLWVKDKLRSAGEEFSLRTKCVNRSAQVFQHSNDYRKVEEIFNQLNQLVPRKKLSPLTQLMSSLLPDLVKLEEQRLKVGRFKKLKYQQSGGTTKHNKFSPAPKFVLFSVVILDLKDFELFTRYCLPSLKAKGNLNSLSKFEVIWNVYGHNKTVSELKKKYSDVFNEKQGANFFVISDKVRNPSLDYLKLQVTSALHQASIRNAKEIDADVFLINPRQIFCENFILSMLKVAADNKQLIFTHAPKISKEGLPYVDDFRDNRGVLNLSKATCKSVISRFLSDFYSASLNTKFGKKGRQYPTAPTFLYAAKSSTKMFTSQIEAIFLSNELIKSSECNGFGLIDGALTRALNKTFNDREVVIAGQDDNLFQFQLDMPANQWNKSIRESGFTEKIASRLKPWDYEALYQQMSLDLDISAFPITSDTEIQTRVDHHYSSIKSIEDEFGGNFFDVYHILTPRHLNDCLGVLLSNQRQIRLAEPNLSELSDIDDAIARCIERFALKFDDHSANSALILMLRLGLEKSINKLITKVTPNLLDRAKIDIWNFVNSDAWVPNLEYFKEELSVRSNEKKLLFSYLFWGERFANLFVDLHLPSLLANGNLPALSKKVDVLIFIVLDLDAKLVLENSAALTKIKRYASVSLLTIPTEIQHTLQRNQRDLNFYLLYGMMDHLGIALAQKLNSSLALIPVDSVVSNRCLTSFWAAIEEGFEVCGGGNIVANEEDFIALITERRSGGVVDLSVKDLALLAQSVPHHYFTSQIVLDQNVDFAAHPRELFYYVDGHIEIRSIFIHPLMVAADCLQLYKRKHYANVDYGMIPRIVFDASKIFLTGIETDAYINNFAEKERVFETLGRGFDLSRFVLEQSNAHAVQRDLFSRSQKLPASYDYGRKTNRDKEIAAVIDEIGKHSN